MPLDETTKGGGVNKGEETRHWAWENLLYMKRLGEEGQPAKETGK